MSGDIGKLNMQFFYESETVSDCGEKILKKLEFEELIKKIGFYQR